MRVRVHQDGFKSANALKWWSVVASVRWRLMSTGWSSWKKDSRLLIATFLNIDEDFISNGVI